VTSEKAAGAKLATMYLRDPENLYDFRDVECGNLGFWIDTATEVFRISRVTMARDLESQLLNRGSRYETARLGTEMAYSLLKKKFRLGTFVLAEPSRPGADLMSLDGRTVAEARLARITRCLSDEELRSQLRRDITQMYWKLRYDMAHSFAEQGYVVFLFLTSDESVKSIVLRIRKE